MVGSNPWDVAQQFMLTIGVVMSALFAYLSARRSREGTDSIREQNDALHTNHGLRPGEYLEMIGDVVTLAKNAATKDELKSLEDRMGQLLDDHTAQDYENFQLLHSEIEELRR